MTNQEIYRAVDIIKKNNLQLRLYFMIGAPQETIEMMQESLTMADALKADETFFALLYPLPGTDIATLCQNEHILKDNNDTSPPEIGPIQKTKFVSSTQIQHFLSQVNRWQMKRYVKDGVQLRGVLFFIDCLRFICVYKRQYQFEMDQLLRWNVQRYTLHQAWKQ
ncbi:MAG: hypothetical protein BV459_05260 [Thermoplasmata archaeon M11B2D]|nr:MAG: hypothetical protein BV459_05260 [Thermoplasmata archaeon M11B2D]